MHLLATALLLLFGLSATAAESPAGAPQKQTNTCPNVISVPVIAGLPVLTSNEIASLPSRLSQAHIESLTDIEGALPRGSTLAGVRYALRSPLDQNGRAHPYTESVFVCRLNEQKDLVVVADNRTGVDVVQRWFIRDLPDPKEEQKK